MEIDVIPFLDYIVGLLGVVVAAVIGVVGKKLSEKYNLEIEDRHRVVLQETLGYGLLLAMNKAKEVYKDTIPLTVRNEVVGTALKHIVKSTPDALKKFGIDPSTPEGNKRIHEMIEARLDTRLFDAKEDNVVDLKPVEPA